MNKRQELEKYNLKASRYQKKKKVDIISTENNRYCLKEENNTNIYEYLRTRNFHNFPPNLTNNSDPYEITEYIDDFEVPEEQRIEDLIYLVSLLHTKTTFYKNVDIDQVKKIYEEIIDRQDYLYNYYSGLQNMIESEVYMSPSHYLLIRNISILYQNIGESKKRIESWYQKVKTSKKLRYAMTHGALEREPLIENNDLYLISWGKARINLPVYDLLNIYQNNKEKIDIFDLLDIYQTKYILKEEEIDLFLALTLLPEKLEMKKTEVQKIKQVFTITDTAYQLREKLNRMNKANSKPKHPI